jgi:predicted permease
MLEIFLSVFPVFLIIFLGVILDRFAILPASAGEVLGHYVLKVALPMLLLSLLSAPVPDMFSQGGFWLGMLASQSLAYCLGSMADRRFGKREGSANVLTGMASGCSNAAFMGLPLIACMFPGEREVMIIAGTASIAPSLMFAYIQPRLEMFASRELAVWPVIKRALLFNPVVLSIVIGALLGGSGIGLWAPLAKMAGMVGGTCGVCALLALGLGFREKLRVARRAHGTLLHKAGRQGAIAFIKLAAHPFMAWLIMYVAGVDGLWMGIGVVMSGVATAMGGYVFAETYGVIAEEYALAAVITNFIGLFTVPALVMLMRFGGYI